MAISRRKFLLGTGLVGGGLIIGFSLRPEQPVPHSRDGSFQPNAWLQITEKGEVIFQLDKTEMGQGVMTGMTTVIAEELDIEPAAVTVEFAGVHPAFANPAMGVQLTGGSTSTPSSWMPLREAGATARAMLVAAAARQWQLPPDACSTDNGRVIHGDKKLAYGELAKAAKEQRVGDVKLKNDKDFKWIGTPVPRLDIAGKVDGTATFGIDIDLPGIKIAVVKRCPHFGGSLKSFDAAAVENRPGVQKVFAIHSGVAVVADSYWQARKAADALPVEWDKGPLAGLSSADIDQAQLKALKEKKPENQMDEGDIESVLSEKGASLDVIYKAPYQHHSPMEPQNTTALVEGDRCEVWCPSQGPEIARSVIAHFTGLSRHNITVHTTFCGGGFGRRGYVDFAGEAGAIAKACPGVPIKLIWSREDDMQHDYYRPATCHGMKAVIDDNGRLTGWQHHLVSTSIVQGFGVDLFSTMLPGWVPSHFARGLSQKVANMAADYDPTMAEGAKIPYSVANIDVGTIWYDPGIRTGFWRSVGHSHNAFVVEGFMDECAHAAGRDPAAFRREYLADKPRHLRVLDALLKLADYGKKPGVHQGLALHESFGAVVGQVAEVSVDGDNFTVERIYCVTECGRVINPDIATAQLESGMIFGLSATIKPGVSFADGATEQSNFHDLPVLRMNETPDMVVQLLDSNEPPSGIGEVAVPPVAPAVANALFNATGHRLRQLPLKLGANANS